MRKNEQFNDILNECLDRILKGQTVEECLQKHPAEAQELEPLLRTALAARVASTIKPRPEFKSRARYEFQAAVRNLETGKTRRPFFSGWQWRWQSAWSMAIIAVLVIVIAGGSTVAAASGSMPDNVLYPVKLATEKVQMAFTFTDIGKAELNVRLADKRVDELVYLAVNGDAQEIQAVARNLSTNLVSINNIVINENALTGASTSVLKNEYGLDSSSQNDSQKSAVSAGQGAPAPVATAGTPPLTTTAALGIAGAKTGISPSPGSVDVPVQPSFQWSVIDGATNYDFQLADDPSFTNTIDSRTNLTSNSLTESNTLDYSKTYYWRVKGNDSLNNAVSQWMANFFKTEESPLARESIPAPVTVGPAIATPSTKFFDPNSGLYFSNETELREYQLSHSVSKANLTNIDKLKQTILSDAINQPARLEEALAKAPPELRPALREAIARALAEYSKLVQNIDNLKY
jgi:hypothetical protein